MSTDLNGNPSDSNSKKREERMTDGWMLLYILSALHTEASPELPENKDLSDRARLDKLLEKLTSDDPAENFPELKALKEKDPEAFKRLVSKAHEIVADREKFANLKMEDLIPASEIPADFPKSASAVNFSLAGGVPLDKDLVNAINKDTTGTIGRFVAYTQQQAASRGLDGNMVANQFWQESKFRPNARSGVGAGGIAQFMPGTAADYDLHGKDVYDPIKSIEAGVRYMADLTALMKNKYNIPASDAQAVALYAYNGGERAIKHLQKNLGSGFTFEKADQYWADQRAAGVTSNSSWAKQSGLYGREILSDGKLPAISENFSNSFALATKGETPVSPSGFSFKNDPKLG